MLGRIYTLTCAITNDVIYVGSTIKSLSTRYSCHLSDSKTGYYPLFKYIRAVKSNPTIELIEEVDVQDEDELRNIEYFWIDQFRQWGFPLKNAAQNKSHKKPKVIPFREIKITKSVGISKECYDALLVLKEKGYLMSHIVDMAIRDKIFSITGKKVGTGNQKNNKRK